MDKNDWSQFVCYSEILLYSRLFTFVACPHEVEPWCHPWYVVRVETLDAKYNLIFR